MRLKQYAWNKAIEVTCSFEGNDTYSSVAGNFDSMYLSLGVLQWNLGSGTLQPMLNRLFMSYPEVAASILPNKGIDLKNALTQRTEKKWALSIQFGSHVIDPWLSAFKELGNTLEWRRIQDSSMSWYKDTAVSAAYKFNLLTDRAFCLFFDIAVQNGNIAYFNIPPELNYHDKLEAIVQKVIDKSNAQWKPIVKERKMLIVNGYGSLYGENRTFNFHDASAFIDDTMIDPIAVLVKRGIISSPDYWLENADGCMPCEGEYVATLMKKATKTSTLEEAVNLLSARQVIDSPEYWLKHATYGNHVEGLFVKTVLRKLAV